MQNCTPTSGSFDNRRLIQQAAVRTRLGNVSPMWLHRHREELPTPILIGGRRFWVEAEIEEFINRLTSARPVAA
jgi:predicted DNA-binding transcriptional regulator AlpA